jgi:predicted dehydrogenase
MIKIGVIGYGYWGPNLVRNFMEAPGSTVVAVCDLRP